MASLFNYALGGIIFLSPFTALAADWSQWRGPDRTGHVPPGESVPAKLPAEAKILWRVKLGFGLASPVEASGKVFCMDNQEGFEALHAFDAANGQELWRTNIDIAVTDTQSASGPRCTPMVDGDRVYAQSSKGELRCLGVADGRVLWHVNFTNDFGAYFYGEKGKAQGATRHGYNGSPLADGDFLFATVGSTNGASMVAFNKKTGRVLWKSQNDEAGYAAPIIAKIGGVRQLIVFSADALFALAPQDGALLWRVPLKTSFSRHATTPVVADDMVMVSSHEIGLAGIKVSRDGEKWQATQAWLSKESAINFSSPVTVGQYLYGVGPAKNFICVDVQTGKQAWARDGYLAGSGGTAFAAFLVMDKNILALTDGGQLVLFPADPKEFKEISVLQVCGKNWCSPAYVNGNLFLRDAKELLCVRLLD
jgi:outer membrane protein assembly factor BamB